MSLPDPASDTAPGRGAASSPADAPEPLVSVRGPDAPAPSDPFGLSPLLAKTAEVLKQARLSPESEKGLLDVMRPELLTTGLANRALDANALARVLAESPVVVGLLERRARSSVLLGSNSLRREDFHLIGAVYLYTELALRDPLLMADMVLLHAGERGLNLVDLHDKLLSLYKNLAADRDSVVRDLLRGEFANTNTTAASAIAAGMISPLIVAAHRAAQQRKTGLLTRVTDALAGAAYETPKELQDLAIIEPFTKQDAEMLRDIAETRTRRTPPHAAEPRVRPAVNRPEPPPDPTAPLAELRPPSPPRPVQPAEPQQSAPPPPARPRVAPSPPPPPQPLDLGGDFKKVPPEPAGIPGVRPKQAGAGKAAVDAGELELSRPTGGKTQRQPAPADIGLKKAPPQRAAAAAGPVELDLGKPGAEEASAASAGRASTNTAPLRPAPDASKAVSPTKATLVQSLDLGASAKPTKPEGTSNGSGKNEELGGLKKAPQKAAEPTQLEL